MSVLANKLRTARYLSANARSHLTNRILRKLSPETSHALIRQLERDGIPIEIDLEVPSWRTSAVVSTTTTLEATATITIPACGLLPEDSHGWKPYRVRELQKTLLDVDSGLAFSFDHVIAQSGSGSRASKDAAFFSGATTRIRKRTPTVVHTPIAPLGDVSHHYHVLLETLPRMLHAKSVNSTVRFVTSSFIPDRYRHLFHDLNLPVDELNPGEVLTGSPLILVDQPDQFWPRSIDVRALAEVLSPAASASTPTRKFYLERGPVSRQPAHEAALARALQERGFESVNLSDFDVHQQWVLASSADTVFSPHGASLAIIPALSPSARVIEFSSGDRFERCYQRIAALHGVSYRFIRLDGSSRNPEGNALDLLEFQL